MPDVAGWLALLALVAVLAGLVLACAGLGRHLRQWGRARRARHLADRERDRIAAIHPTRSAGTGRAVDAPPDEGARPHEPGLDQPRA